MIYIDKDCNMFSKSCGGEKTEILTNQNLIPLLDHPISLEEGFTLRNYFEFIKKYHLENINPAFNRLYDFFAEYRDCEASENDYEYISIVKEYDLYIQVNSEKLNHMIQETKIEAKIEGIDDWFTFFENSFYDSGIYNLEIRIEDYTVEYNDCNFIFQTKISLLDFIHSICDCTLIEF